MRRLAALSNSLICKLKTGLFENSPQLQTWLLGSRMKKSRGAEIWNFLWYILTIGHIVTVAVCYTMEHHPTLVYYHLLFVQFIMCLLFAAEIWISS
uniref:Uncharacterized protein n=1 Tax=Romanomermis culicivorax TaxID=13658 RepID=A0A915JD73_ROMCU